MTSTLTPPDAAAHLAALVESSEDAIISKRLDGTIISWNQGARNIFGYEREEMIGRSIRTLIPAVRQFEEDDVITRVVAGNRVGAFLTERLHRDGSIVRVSITVSPILDSGGRIVAASTILRDAGPILDQQAAAMEAEQRFRMLADNMSQLAWIADSSGWIFWYNKRWHDFTGTTLDEMEGWGWKTVHHPDHVDRVVTRIQHSWDTGEPWEDTFPLRGADGDYRWFLSRALPIRDEDGNIRSWFGTNTDITELREKEEQIRLLLMEVNHRSKNMLAVVQSLLRRSATGDADFVARFERRLASLAANQDLLTRRGWTAIPVGELVEAQLSFLGAAALKQATINGPPFMLSPRAAETLGMALHELATNALKHGALGQADGRIAIEWRVEDGEFAMTWRESGLPMMPAAERIGFGTTLIRDVPARSLNAAVDLDLGEAGLTWKLTCRADAIATREGRAAN